MSRKSVIILKSHLSKLGGLEKQTLRISQEFGSQGCRVTILTNGPFADVVLPSGVEVVNVGTTPKMSYAHIRKFDQLCQDWISKNPGEVIFGVERNTGVTHYRAGNGVHAEYLAKRFQTDSFLKRFSFRWNPMHRAILQIEKETYEDGRLQKLFTNSEMVKQEILQYYQVNPEKIEVIHNGVEWNELEVPFQQWCSMPRKSAPYHFLFVGNGYQRKGLEYILKALGQIKSDSFQLSVVGKEKKLSYFQNLTQTLGLDNQVTFYGSQKNLIPFYHKADALLIPSLYDPFANVTVEALAMGLQVVSSSFNGGKEVLNEETGVVISDLFDQDSIVCSLDKVMRERKSVESARRCRKSVKHLTFENQLKKMVAHTLQE